MNALSIISSGMVTAVGLNAPASCAAIRCAIDNFQECRYIGQGGEWQVAASVPLDGPWLGFHKLTEMAAKAISEALHGIPKLPTETIPLLLCLSEPERAERPARLDADLLPAIEHRLGRQFHPDSCVIAKGRVSGAVALHNARRLIHQQNHAYVVIAGVDSYLSIPMLTDYDRQERLLNNRNSNGFIPGEAAAAVLVEAPMARQEAQLLCLGLGFGKETATIDSELPLRANGLVAAIRNAENDAGFSVSDLDYRISDLSGEHYYFKEAALAMSRTVRSAKESFYLQHPADCIGETGAAIGPTLFSVLLASCRKGYSLGDNILCHMANDAGERAAAFFSYQVVGERK